MEFQLKYIYKALPSQVLKILVDMFNQMLQSERIPQKWCKGIIILLFKSGDATLVDNYRGITLLTNILKLFFTVLLHQIYEWAEQHNVFPLEQFGFRPGHRTADAIFILTLLIQKACSTHGQLCCCFLDFKKAFDSVNHQLFFHKLHTLSMDSKLLRLLIYT